MKRIYWVALDKVKVKLKGHEEEEEDKRGYRVGFTNYQLPITNYPLPNIRQL